MTDLHPSDLARWQQAHRRACEAESTSAWRWLRPSPSDQEFLLLRSRELRIEADCMLANMVARSRSACGRRIAD